jgi:hypothetical protein
MTADVAGGRPARPGIGSVLTAVALALAGIALVGAGLTRPAGTPGSATGHAPAVPARTVPAGRLDLPAPPVMSPSPDPVATRALTPAEQALRPTAPMPLPGVGAGHGGATTPPGPEGVRALARSVPVTLDIPRIGVHTSLGQVGLTRQGTIAIPAPRGGLPAYWYRYLSTPGEAGPAVILGHVDTARDGPAVFFRLGDLQAGDLLMVRRADGSAPRFVVRAVARYPKDHFPTAAVYGPTGRPVLRLITCGGLFDPATGHYRDNVVVFATLAG